MVGMASFRLRYGVSDSHEPSPSRPTLPLTVEIYSTDGRSKAILLGECPGVEVFAIPIEVHHLSASLSEQDEHEAVDPGRRLGRFVVN